MTNRVMGGGSKDGLEVVQVDDEWNSQMNILWLLLSMMMTMNLLLQPDVVIKLGHYFINKLKRHSGRLPVPHAHK